MGAAVGLAVLVEQDHPGVVRARPVAEDVDQAKRAPGRKTDPSVK